MRFTTSWKRLKDHCPSELCTGLSRQQSRRLLLHALYQETLIQLASLRNLCWGWAVGNKMNTDCLYWQIPPKNDNGPAVCVVEAPSGYSTLGLSISQLSFYSRSSTGIAASSSESREPGNPSILLLVHGMDSRIPTCWRDRLWPIWNPCIVGQTTSNCRPPHKSSVFWHALRCTDKIWRDAWA